MYIEKNVRQEGKTKWEDAISTAPNANIEYRLHVVNGTELEVAQPVIYDVFPKKGDETLYNGERGSQFSNRLANRDIKIPAGWKVQYACDENVTNANVSGASWQDSRCGKVTALKFVADKISPRTDAEMIVPMLACLLYTSPSPRD